MNANDIYLLDIYHNGISILDCVYKIWLEDIETVDKICADNVITYCAFSNGVRSCPKTKWAVLHKHFENCCLDEKEYEEGPNTQQQLRKKTDNSTDK